MARLNPNRAAASRPRTLPKPPRNVHFEPFENRAYDMSYACLLIPRDPEHLLSGKVADFIQKSIQNVCIAFGWHLMQVQVQPEYFQWVVEREGRHASIEVHPHDP